MTTKTVTRAIYDQYTVLFMYRSINAVSSRGLPAQHLEFDNW